MRRAAARAVGGEPLSENVGFLWDVCDIRTISHRPRKSRADSSEGSAGSGRRYLLRQLHSSHMTDSGYSRIRIIRQVRRGGGARGDGQIASGKNAAMLRSEVVGAVRDQRRPAVSIEQDEVHSSQRRQTLRHSFEMAARCPSPPDSPGRTGRPKSNRARSRRSAERTGQLSKLVAQRPAVHPEGTTSQRRTGRAGRSASRSALVVP